MTNPNQEFYDLLDQSIEPLMKYFDEWNKLQPTMLENVDAETATIANSLTLIAMANINIVSLLRKLIEVQVESNYNIIQKLDDIETAIMSMGFD